MAKDLIQETYTRVLKSKKVLQRPNTMGDNNYENYFYILKKTREYSLGKRVMKILWVSCIEKIIQT